MGDLGGDHDQLPPKSDNLFLQIVEHPDGTVTRPAVPLVPASAAGDVPALSKDVPLNPAHGTWLRIYLPNPVPEQEAADAKKLPIILFFHGGGFVLFSAATVFYHASCEQMARAVPAVVVSLDYRLAPEHRLPAAYEDAEEALLWLRAQAQRGPQEQEPWLARHGDFSRCFAMGSSSGANMAYRVGLRAAGVLDLAPLGLAGLVLNQPYFGGAERTPAEAASEEDPMLPLRANDALWRLALPKGADRAHEFCDPRAEELGRLPACLVAGCEGDPLVDRQREFVERLQGGGARSVVARIDEGEFHANELFDPARAEALFAAIREFVDAAAAAAPPP